MNERPIQLHPEARRLAEENELLREELTTLLTEEDTLLTTVRPHLLALYQTRIGPWEVRLLQAQCASARSRRKLELAQAMLNRGLPPDPSQIEANLELEYRSWMQKVREAAERIEAAEHRLKHLLAPADDREFKRLYRCIVRRLHPDLNPNLTQAQRTLWNRAQAAHHASDLAELRALALLSEKPEPEITRQKPLELLLDEQAVLRRQVAALLSRIEGIQDQPPFTLRQNLNDEAWLAARRHEIEVMIGKLESDRALIEARLRQILPDPNHGPGFSQN